ncbi:CDP-glycerol glycerophosphotransferase family protein [Streptomyces millisiae]|uniref:CDP-glycerol glycerophosphotransferase family protein n=1 Tax=Streptomyces millisiae TaxID=3075542 RepID=A0ABU2LQE4_9ACTN|nr:CDP-glycerol glycerophosphotransferase family protein [Streptomyces sp. DSM 44918]MDT0319258.1 CDP-glycerol glycerophosphotransferase family protein [Streptomyces sp. DSM 44918]
MVAKPEDIIPEELARRLRFLPEATDEDQRAFLDAAAEFLAAADSAKLRKLPPIARIKWELVRERRLADLLTVIDFERVNPSAFPVRGRLRPYVAIPGVDSRSLPASVTRLRLREMPVRAKATEVLWQDGKIVVHGYAFVANLPNGPGTLPRLAWLRAPGGRRIPVRFRAQESLRATRDSKQALHNYDNAGFEITIDPAKLKSRGKWKSGTWGLTLALPRPGGYVPGKAQRVDVGSAGHSQARYLGDGARLIAGFHEDVFQLTIDVPEAEVTDQTATADALRLGLRSPAGGKRPTKLRVVRKGQQGGVEYPLAPQEAGDGDQRWARWGAEIPFDDLTVATEPTEKTHDFITHIEFADGSSRRATVLEGFLPGRYLRPGGREIAVTTDGPGLLKLHDRARQAVVDRMEWTRDGVLLVEGSYTGPGDRKRFVLRHGERFEEHVLPLNWTDSESRFSVRITPDKMTSYDAVLPLRAGRWYFSLRDQDAWGNKGDVPVKLRADLIDTLPLKKRVAGRTYAVNRRYFDRLFLGSGPVLRGEERGAYRQRELRQVHTPAFKREPLTESVFYNSFGGKQFSDSPRAIYEEFVRRGIEVEHLWSVADAQVDLPPGVRPVEWHSREWYEALARSRYVVTNVGLGDWYERRDGQCVVQTWHGTPLKKIGADLLGTPKANLQYIASLPHRFRQFDFVVSPNAFTTPIMRNAFRCEGEILESGYPRNDIFHRPDREKIAQRVRATLGIPEGRKVVLYAPTWRDDQRHTASKFKLDLRVDLTAAREALSDDHVFLFRKHPKILDAIPGAGQGFVYDVSAYPDIAELYLITDVLITDYSSVLFDFAHSGKPMLFFTYDLEHYRDTLRGFYFDFTERAPGPLIKTSAELIHAIRTADTVRRTYDEKYAAFVRDFCEPSDGLATARVVDRMLEIGQAKG